MSLIEHHQDSYVGFLRPGGHSDGTTKSIIGFYSQNVNSSLWIFSYSWHGCSEKSPAQQVPGTCSASTSRRRVVRIIVCVLALRRLRSGLGCGNLSKARAAIPKAWTSKCSYLRFGQITQIHTLDIARKLDYRPLLFTGS